MGRLHLRNQCRHSTRPIFQGPRPSSSNQRSRQNIEQDYWSLRAGSMSGSCMLSSVPMKSSSRPFSFVSLRQCSLCIAFEASQAIPTARFTRVAISSKLHWGQENDNSLYDGTPHCRRRTAAQASNPLDAPLIEGSDLNSSNEITHRPLGGDSKQWFRESLRGVSEGTSTDDIIKSSPKD